MFRSLSFKKFQGPVEKLERICKETGKAEKLGPLFEKFPDCRESINTIRYAGCTPLHEAVKNNFLEVVKYLIENTPIDVNARIEVVASSKSKVTSAESSMAVQVTALCIAVCGNNVSIANVLLAASQSLDVNVLDERHDSVFHVACERGHLRLAKKLLDVGASMTLTNRNGLTPLLICASLGHTSLVSFFIESMRADANEVDDTNTSALHYACRGDHFDTASYLVLQANADKTIVNSDGFLPVDSCVPNSRIVELFRNTVKDNSVSEPAIVAAPVKVCEKGIVEAVEVAELLGEALLDDDEDYECNESSRSSPQSDDNSQPTVNSGPEDGAASNKSREGRVSFRTQSTENITFPGLLPEPLPPLPPNSSLHRTLSYTKPRRKSSGPKIVTSGDDDQDLTAPVPSEDLFNNETVADIGNSAISKLFPSTDFSGVSELSSPTGQLKRRSSSTDIPQKDSVGEPKIIPKEVASSTIASSVSVDGQVKGSLKKSTNLSLDTSHDSSFLETALKSFKSTKRPGYELRDMFGPIASPANGISPDGQSDGNSFDFDNAEVYMQTVSGDDQDVEQRDSDIEIIEVFGLELIFSPDCQKLVFFESGGTNQFGEQDSSGINAINNTDNADGGFAVVKSQSGDEWGTMSLDKVFEATNNLAHCLVSDFDDVSPMQQGRFRDHPHSYLNDVGVSLSNADAVAILTSDAEFEDNDDGEEIPFSPRRPGVKPTFLNSKVRGVIEVASLVARLEGRNNFAGICKAFFVWKDILQVDNQDSLGEFPANEFDSASIERADRQYLTAVLSMKLLALCEFVNRHYANGKTQAKLNAWHKLRTHKSTLVSSPTESIPPAVRVVFKLNEKPLWALFCNYVTDRLDIPVTKTDHLHHKKKLLSVQACWQLLKDFGVVPFMCRRQRLVELIEEAVQCDSVKEMCSLECNPEIYNTISSPSFARKSLSPSRRQSFHYRDPTPRKASTPSQRATSQQKSATPSPLQNSPAFSSRRSSIAPDEKSVQSRRRNSIIAKLFSPEALAEERKGVSSSPSSTNRMSDPVNNKSPSVLNRLFGVSALSELKGCGVSIESVDRSPSSSRSQSPPSPVRNSDPKNLFSKPTPKSTHGVPFLGENMKTFTGPVLSYNDFNHLLWRLVAESIEEPTLGPTSRSLHLLFIMDSSNGRLEMKRSCKYPEDIPPFLLKELSAKSRAKAILSRQYSS